MSYDLSIGGQVEARFLHAGQAIAQDVLEGKFATVRNKLNHSLFSGGHLEPKSFNHLLSIYDPSEEIGTKTFPITYPDPIVGWKKKPGERYGIVTIEKKISFSAILGYLEAIPFIGSVLAIINLIGQSIGLAISYKNLQNASRELIESEGNKDVLEKTMKVFAEALKFTKHRNYLVGSALSLFPFVKPFIRLAQGIRFNNNQNTARPSSKPAASYDWREFVESGERQYQKRCTKKKRELSTQILSSRILPTFKGMPLSSSI